MNFNISEYTESIELWNEEIKQTEAKEQKYTSNIEATKSLLAEHQTNLLKISISTQEVAENESSNTSLDTDKEDSVASFEGTDTSSHISEPNEPANLLGQLVDYQSE